MRLFIGLALDADTRAALWDTSGTLQATLSGNYVRPPLYHVTLAYLGERDESRLPTLHALLSETAADFAPLPLVCDAVGWFGHGTNAILYAGLAPSAELAALNNALRARLDAVHEPFDRKPLVPHITLARKVSLPDDFSPTVPKPHHFQAEALTLFHSTRADGALCYLPVWQAPLARNLKEVHP